MRIYKLVATMALLPALVTGCRGSAATPVPTITPAVQQALPVQELKVQSPDVTLYVRVAGNAPSGNVLIAINGGPGLSSHYMLSLENLAGPNFAVVTYDQRGVSRSSAPPQDPANYTLAKYVADLEAVRQAVGVETVYLLGHSWGGLVAMRYATIYPQRVRAIVLVDSGAPTWKDMLAGMSRFSERVAVLQARGILPQDLTRQEGQDDPVLRAYFSDPHFWFSPDDKGGPPEFSQVANQLTWTAIQGLDLTAEVAKLTHPVLVLWGQDDPFGVPMAEATVAALSSAKVEYVLLDKCGHFWHECPEQFYPRVRAFLGLDASRGEAFLP
jgi:pimeloyl-ACP methyl ester carboxylesterase